MLVRYFIPEDGDEQQHPNVFTVNFSTAQPTLAEIKDAFPVRGYYHFRFLRTVAGHTVWMDLLDDKVVLPLHQGGLFMKVSRTTKSGPMRSVPPSVGAANLMGTGKSENVGLPPPSKPVKPTKEASDKQLLNFSEDTTQEMITPAVGQTVPATAAAAGISTDNDLLGFESTPTPPAASSSNQDFFGLEALKPTQAPPPMMGGGAAAPIMSNGMGAGVRNSMTGGPMGSNRPMNGGPMGGGPMGGGMNAMGGSRGSSNSNLYGMGQGMPFQKNPYSQNDPFNDLSGLQPGGASPSTQGNRGRSY